MIVDMVGLARRAALHSYAAFFKAFWRTISQEPLHWNWHMDVICDYLQAQAERVSQRLPRLHDTAIFNVPPGTSKSSIASVMFPPYVWARWMPEAQFICASHTDDLALDLSNKSRDVVKSELYQKAFPDIALRRDQDTKTFFKNTNGGYRYAVGSGGTVTGFHGHFIIVDDPIDPSKALSEAELKATNHWMRHQLRQRLIKGGFSVFDLIMQRLHQDDPTAQALRRRNVMHFRIPASLEYRVHPPELKEHYKDGLMDPVRLPKEELEAERAPEGLGEYGYAGQYGQDPVPSGGGKFKTHMILPGIPPTRFKRVARFWDKAASEDAGAYSVGLLMARDHDNVYWVLDVIRKQWDSATRERVIRSTAKHDGRAVILGIEQEGGSGGKESAEATLARNPGRRTKIVQPRGDKVLRADEFSVFVNAGRVKIPVTFHDGGTWQGWAATFIEELAHFPFSTFKDQVDAAAGAFNLLWKRKRRMGAYRRKHDRNDTQYTWADDPIVTT